MRPLTTHRGLLTLAWAFALVCGALPAAAAGGVASGRPLATTREAGAPESFHLGRATAEQRFGRLREVVENLETIDFSTEPSFAEADRAAFLLGQAYLGLGSVARFVELAGNVARWKRSSVYTRWLAVQLQLIESEGAGAAQRLVAGLDEIAATTPLALYFKALALDDAGQDTEAEWTKLADTDSTTALGRDLVGAAIVRRATLALARGEDARELLATVPHGSHYASRARHMLGLATIEKGDAEAGNAILQSLLADDPSYAERREVMLALAGRDLDLGQWEPAHHAYQRIDRDWESHRDTLQWVLANDAYDALWSSWQSNGGLSDAVFIDALPLDSLMRRLATESENLHARPEASAPSLAASGAAAGFTRPVAPPAPEARQALAASARDLGEARHQGERTRWALAREREALDAKRLYFGDGLARARRSAAELEAHATLLDSLRRTLDWLDARLQTVRDESTRRILTRSAAILESCANDILWLRGMRRFHIEGPNRQRALPMPHGVPSPESLLIHEEALAHAVQATVEGLAADAPDLIARSYEKFWRPNLVDRALALSTEAARALARARALAASIDSNLAVSGTSEELRRLEARANALQQRTDSLSTAHDALRKAIAREAVERALAALESEREAIDYGLAASAYGSSVRLDRPGTADTSAVARRAAGPGDEPARDSSLTASDPNEPLDDPEAMRWRGQAVVRVRGFLERHPESFARGEMRFRLADLLLIDARHEFREQMARYLREQEAGRVSGPPPVLSHAPALELYRAILTEDRGFEHRDAVLFNAGMILADEGSPEAASFFDELVTNYPASIYTQESHLRMGDTRFNEQRFQESIALYQQAAGGADPSLQAIALYKMGWAHYNQDRFLEAADAFRTALDLYASERGREIRVDVESEAEAYLVHSLAGAGGAAAHAQFFDRIGKRPYERRVLMAMGQQFRRHGRFAEAAAADELCIARYPSEADALIGVQRLVETHRRANRPALVRETQLKYAPQFAPGSEWYAAQTSDSVRAAGADFARTAWKSVALHHHHRARESGSRQDWGEALRHYQTLLAKWPKDPEAASFELSAGEASAKLGDHEGALAHYGAAAATGRDSIASQAMMQQIAVTDAWYQGTRESKPAALGRDSLAHAVIEAADQLLERYPHHPEAADLVWRQANLSFAHGWNERAARDFERMAKHYPTDERAPRAAILRADALFRDQRFEEAGGAYEAALAAAQRAGVDSLQRRAGQAIPIAYYRHAESTVAADSSNGVRHAALFEKVAARWPEYEHAHQAQYRAGLAYIQVGRSRDGVMAMQRLIADFPESEYVKDAHLQIAKTWESSGEHEKSAEAYARFAERYAEDPSARDAWLKAADLYETAGANARAEELRLAYIRKYPDDHEGAMEILEKLARRDLASVGPERPISTLLPPPAKTTKGTKASKSAKAPKTPLPSHLAEYLRLAEAHPTLASRSLLAQVQFLHGEEAYAAYDKVRLTQPLKTSIPAKQKQLDQVMKRYRQSVELGVSEWTHASTFRIGEALVAFGVALERSDRPADLKGDDLYAYEDVLMQRSRALFDRGETVWSDLLRQKGREGTDDPWIVRARTSLWLRLGNRFFYQPELEFPTSSAQAPERIRSEKLGQDQTAADKTGQPSADAQSGDRKP